MTTAKFGCQLPQDNPNIARIFEVAKDCETLGYDSVWAYDHLAPYWIRTRSSLEGWSLISAVAARTTRIKVGSLVTNVTLRNPSLLAKITSTVDNISGGRLIVGLGIGDKMSIPELRSYGYPFPNLEARLTLLRETIIILKSMWTGTEVSFRGKTLKLSHAICKPKPKQKTGPPIWVGGSHRRLLDVTAELADGWYHWGLTGEKLHQLEAYIHSKCREFHRPPDSITVSWAGNLAQFPTGDKLRESAVEEWKSRIGEKTSYFIASFPANAGRKAYEGFAEAVKSIA